MKRAIVAVLASMLLALGLAACGSANYGPAGTSSTPPSGAY